MSKHITRTVQPSRRTLLKTVGAVGVAAAGGVLSRQVFSPAIAGAGAEDQARLDRGGCLPLAARLWRREGHLRQA